MIEQYVNSGLITFEYADFALLGPESNSAAEAAACALDQGMFWEYHKTIFANHQGSNSGGFSDGRLKEMADIVGLNRDEFDDCYDSGIHEDAVTDSYNAGAAQGVGATPTLSINGELVQYRGWDDLQAQIDAALATE